MLVWIGVSLFPVDLADGPTYVRGNGEVVICDINARTRTLHTEFKRVYTYATKFYA